MSCDCHTFAGVYSLLPCGHLWERSDLLVLVCDVKLYFYHFPMWYPRSGVVLDCNDLDISDLCPLSFSISYFFSNIFLVYADINLQPI